MRSSHFVTACHFTTLPTSRNVICGSTAQGTMTSMRLHTPHTLKRCAHSRRALHCPLKLSDRVQGPYATSPKHSTYPLQSSISNSVLLYVVFSGARRTRALSFI